MAVTIPDHYRILVGSDQLEQGEMADLFPRVAQD